MVIGICGGSGSGKTTLLERLFEYYSSRHPSYFVMDNYYYPIEEQAKDENGKVNFDLPTALNREKLISDFKTLLNGQAITVKKYTFNVNRNSNIYVNIPPSELIFIEGLFLFEYQELSDLIDYKIFVDLQQDVQFERRLARDQMTRGYTHEDILYQWNNHVKPCFKKYLAPYEENADFRFNNHADFETEFQRLVKALQEHSQIFNGA